MNTQTPESAQTPVLEPGIYIVATPIGNLGDMTMRAIETLKRCDVIACEDTRVTGRLLKHFDIETRMQRYDDHASNELGERLVERAKSEAVALVSDAGTPLVSDPGYRLVRTARQAGVRVVTIPGACAAVAGLTLSGLPNDRFLFAGFLPPKDKARRDVLEEVAAVDGTLIFYESGPRLVKSLSAIAELWPQREVSVAREITKLHEECRTGSAQDLTAHYTDHPPKGEIVLMVGPPVEQGGEVDADELLIAALADMSPSKAAGQVAKSTGLDRKALYTRAVELKGQ